MSQNLTANATSSATGMDALADKSLMVGLAPMEGVTDIPTRLWFSQTSAPALQWTPFLRVTPTFPHRRPPVDYAPELQAWRGAVNYALIPQFMAADETSMLRAAELFLPFASYLDLNCGCPAPNALKGGAGVSLLRDAALFRQRLEFLLRGMGEGRLSVKMRTGFHSAAEFPILLDALADLPLRHVTVHGRTRLERYRGTADWDLIRLASERLPVPILGSGDVCDRASWVKRRAMAPKLAGHIVGRGALRQAWVFDELKEQGPGSSNTIPYQSLREALFVFLLWQEAQKRHDEALSPLVLDGHLRGKAGRDPEAWGALRAASQRLLYQGKVPEEGTWHRASLGRLKMLWSSLRSSLPPLYFSPLLLRANSPEAFFAGIDALHREQWQKEGEEAATHLNLAYRPELDWLYAGGKASEPAHEAGSES